MNISKYQPCWHDPRVQRRVRRALGWSTAVLSTDQPHAWSTRYIDRYLGSQRNQLSQYLRQQLLIVTTHRYNRDTGQCKQYVLNPAGVEFLSNMLAHSDPDPSPDSTVTPRVTQICESARLAWIEQDFSTEIQTGEFVYQERSHRLFHPIQNIRTQHRELILARWGYGWQYDIRSSAPTLIQQHAQHLGMTRPTPTLTAYLDQRHLYRQVLAETLQIPERTAKRIITALFCGARLGPETAIAQELNHDLERVYHLRQMTWIQELRQDIRDCWRHIQTDMPVRFIPTQRGVRRQALQPRDKWMRYFELERQVLNQVRRYLQRTHNRHFLEHDGWACENQIFESELRDHIRRATGFDIEFDRKSLL